MASVGFWVRIGGAGVALAAMGACTAILGNDFTIEGGTAGANGGAGQGNDGGGAAGPGGTGGDGGAGGLGPPPPFVCDWELAEHTELIRLEGTSQYFTGDLHVLRRNDTDARVIIGHDMGANTEVKVFTVGANPVPPMSSFPADEVLDAQRSSIQEIAVLYSVQAGGGQPPEMHLRLIDDSEDDGSSSDDEIITDVNSFPNINPTSPNLEARFAVVSGITSGPVIDILATWLDSSSQYQTGYARYQGSVIAFTPLTATGFTQQDDAEVTALHHHNGITYAYLGESSPLGCRGFQLGPAQTLPQTPTQIGELDTFLFSFGGGPDATAFTAVDFGPPLQMLIGEVDNDDLASFDPNAFALIGEYDDLMEIPALSGRPTFHGRLWTIFGRSLGATGNPDMTHWFIDTDGNQRALGPLPFTATLPVNELRSDSLIGGGSAVVDPMFDTMGGALHVAWVEYHESPADSSFPLIYYDRLACTLGDP